MGPFAQLLDALAEKRHALTVASECGDRTLADRTRRDARAIHGELFTSRSRWRARRGRADLTTPHVLIVESDVPEAMTLREWRRSRARKPPPLVRLVRRVRRTQRVASVTVLEAR